MFLIPVIHILLIMWPCIFREFTSVESASSGSTSSSR